MSATARLHSALLVGGVAGLAYEIVWSRYLGLFVGHSAYAQMLVLAVYLGGMSIGALLVADLSRQVRRPILWYAAAEALLAVAGVAFDPLYRAVTGAAYDHVFPLVASGSWVGAVRWGISGLTIFPQAVVLGATFPFATVALARLHPAGIGTPVARAYLFNTLGGAAGVLLTGFVLIGRFGLPGTLGCAAALNLCAATLAWSARSRTVGMPTEAHTPPTEPLHAAPPRSVSPELVRAMLGAAFLTAVASFAYQISWIRMLSLVLGSATHSFELMLGAFILGLALGAWWIRRDVDELPDPVRRLGGVQIAMGALALASLPAYLLTFQLMAPMVRELPGTPMGYALFNLGRFGLCLLVMLPATVAAGMTLPLITTALGRTGWGERSIGAAYGINTVGAVIGIAGAGLLAMPSLGMRGLLVAGASLDMTLGVFLLWLSARWSGTPRRRAALSAALAAGLTGLSALGMDLDARILTSGVFRDGVVPSEDDREVLFHRDGRTATISAHVLRRDGLVVLSTNGKADASLGARWYRSGRDTLPPVPLERGRDYTTQVLPPLIGLAHVPDARSVAIIGHGSGMSGRAFLTSPAIERLVTIEIEPAMVEGSAVFLPENEAVFTDSRSVFVFDDAKSFLSYRDERYDIVFAEPSNPWVSGTAGLFTVEFYERMRRVLARGGVLIQWMQLYEFDDDLLLSALAALETSFPTYQAYLVGAADIVVVASAEASLPVPSWHALDEPALLEMTSGIPRFRGEHIEGLRLFDQAALSPLTARIRPNSDFRPTLDLGAERARFERKTARGALSFSDDRIDVTAAREGLVRVPRSVEGVPARDLQPVLDLAHATWIRQAVAEGGGTAPRSFPGWTSTLLQLRNFFELLAAKPELSRTAWLEWADDFVAIEGYLHRGTSGWIDDAFFQRVDRHLAVVDPPAAISALVELLRGVNTFDWTRVAGAADILVPRVVSGEAWIDPGTLLDAAVLGYVLSGRSHDARDALTLLGPLTGHDAGNLRIRLLEEMAAPR